MKTSEPGKIFIENREGFSPTAYPDADGLSIGFGTFLADPDLLAKYKDATITKVEARGLMERKLEKIEATINRLVKVPLSQWEFDALASFIYNVGEGKKGFAGSTLLRKLNAEDRPGTAAQFPRWFYSQGKPDDGLKARRLLESRLFSGDVSVYSL